MAVTVHLLGDKDRIVDSALAVDDGVLVVEGVTENNGVVGVSSSTSGDGRVKAFATRKGKEYCSHTQCQGESQRLRG